MSVNGLLLNSSFSTTLYFLVGFLLRLFWQLREALRDKPPTSFYPCRSKTGHPILYSLEAREAFQERPHLYFGSQKGDPHGPAGRSHQLGRKKPEAEWRFGSNWFQLGTLWQDTVLQKLPECDQEFARQRDNPNPSQAAATFGKAFSIPAAQLAVWLVS